ncbi:MAG: M14 family metallopeptidase [bacterium]|nr:M14 family metallopeptidase [bacterium]
MQGDLYFSEQYKAARKRFRNAARAANAQLHKLRLGSGKSLKGPLREKLSIDIAILGNPRPKRALIHSSGVHGVEGFAGSAIQLRALENPPDLPEDGGLIFIHCVNPYGMAFNRRVNESNVDLNRNFLKKGQWKGAHEAYHLLHRLLNPERMPRLDLFIPRLALKAARHGFERLKQAGAEGQYEYPDGLFFGGQGLEDGPKLLLKWIKKHLKQARRVCAIDVHTGVGEPGQDWLIIDRAADGRFVEHMEPHYGSKRLDAPAENADAIAYTIRGGLDAGLVKALHKKSRLDFVTQEFGTPGGGPALLKALRSENHWVRRGAELDHPARLRLKEAFSPLDIHWQRSVVDHGFRLVERTARFLFDGQNEGAAAQRLIL